MTRSALLGLLANLLTGCAQQMYAVADVALEEAAVVAVSPPAGAILSREATVEVVLGERGRGHIPQVLIQGADRSWRPDCSLDESELWAVCETVTLPGSQSFSLQVTVDGVTTRETTFQTLTAAEDAHQLNPGVEVVELCESSVLVENIQGMMQGSDMIAVVAPDADDAMFLSIGPADISAAGAAVATPGLVFTFPVELSEDGTLQGSAEAAFLPVHVDTTTVNLLVQDLEVEGRMIEGALVDLSIDGHIPAASLVRMVEPLGALGAVVLSQITLDVDRDGDGEQDAARLLMEGDTVGISLN